MIEPTKSATEYIGRSAAACAVRAQIAAFGASDASVLLLGASGTGKEIAARRIHDLSARRDRPFVVVDCAGLGDGLAESELFGHVRGAFTGAVAARQGLFAEADGGTLFLDEVCSASPQIQARLLRVLETREVRAVGSNTARQVDVRIVAAANRDLNAEVRNGRFREDLLFRLDVLRLVLPTVADRVADIPALAVHLLAQIERRTGAPAWPTTDALAELQRRPWPGNVRQLRNALEHAAALARGGPIDVHHLPEVQDGLVPSAERHGTPAITWRAWQEAQEREFLLAQLEGSGWNRSATARSLGISRQSLHDKLRRLRLRPSVSFTQDDDARETGGPVLVSTG